MDNKFAELDESKVGETDPLGEYVGAVLGLNQKGKTSWKSFFSVTIPSNAVPIAIIVVDLIMLAAEYRVWDIGYQLTGSPYKAIGFVLISAVPFYLAHVLWLYPLANTLQRGISLVMIALSLWTSAQFGFADLTRQYDLERIYAMVINLTAFYVIALLVYIISDDTVKLRNMEIVTMARAAFQGRINVTTGVVLSNLRKQLEKEEELRKQFGNKAVENHMRAMGIKPAAKNVQYNSEENRPNP